jgi:hypothetical protein
MRTINRSAFVVRPREPYLRWTASLDAEARSAADSLRSRTAVYLVAEDPEEREETPPIEDYFARIFAFELSAWCTDESQWPHPRDLRTFQAWFEVAAESIVIDLEATPLRTEEL